MQEQSRKLLDKEFREYHLSSSIPSMKVGLIVTFLLFISYSVFNSLALGNVPEQQYFLKFGLIVPILLISFIVLFIKPLAKHLTLIFVLLNLISCLAIYYVGITSDISSRGYNYFYAWVMLVMVGMHTFFRIRFRDLIILNVLQLLAYILATLFNHSYIQRFLSYNNLFFVLSATTLGFFISYIFQSLNWKNFLHQKALTENYHKLIIEIRDRKEAEDEVLRSERQYHEALDCFPDWVIVVDRDLNVIMANSTLKQLAADAGILTGLVGQNIANSFPFIRRTEIDDIKAVFETGRISIGEISFEIEKQLVFVETRKIPMIRNNEVDQVMIVTRDRSKEKEVEALKLRNAETKEIMLREIHHRVKNNLSIVVSLLNMQAKKNPDPEFQKLTKDIELRIRSMALIHEHLYRSENLDRIPLSTYLRSLATIISSTFSGNFINIDMDLDNILANIGIALPIGLITNEMMTNSFKYAFHDKRAGTIRLKLEKYFATGFKLTISDNGIGLPKGFDFQKQDSLGMFMIKLLVEQLDGTVNFTTNGGVTASIIVPNFNL